MPDIKQAIQGAVRHPVIHGHPLHALLSDFPVALVPTAFVTSAFADVRPSAAATSRARSAMRAALAGSLAAGGVGWWDWLTIPREHAARRPATLHGLLNSGMLACVGAATLRRRERTALLGVASATLAVAAWIGGDLVFRLGWRVHPAETIEMVEPQLRERGLIGLIDDANQQIADFEQRETYLAPRG